MARPPQLELTIAELAESARVTPRTIRYYVAEGLLPPPGGSGQRRIYGQGHLDRLAAIRRLKAAYLPLQEIRRKLVSAHPDADTSALVSAWSAPRTDATSGGSSQPMGVPATAVGQSTAAFGPADALPFGLGRQPQLGHVEIYEPTESVWHRYVLASGIELHYQDTDDPKRKETIERLIRVAETMLDEPGKKSGGKVDVDLSRSYEQIRPPERSDPGPTA